MCAWSLEPVCLSLNGLPNPFLFQTSDPTLIDATHSAAPVLRKPFRPEQLIAALAALLATKER